MRRKTVVVLESGRIPELNVRGPIQTPTRINIKNIALMVNNGKNVLECDPKDPHNQDKRIKLTPENVGKENFGEAKSKVVVETVKNEKPEEKKTDEQEKPSEPKTEEKKETPKEKKTKVVVETVKNEKVEEKKTDEQEKPSEPKNEEKKETPKEKNKDKK